MEEPVQKKLYASAMHKQQKITYISCGMAAIIIGLVVVFCHFLYTGDSSEDTNQSSEVYILKDEVVDTSYLHSQHTMFNLSLQ